MIPYKEPYCNISGGAAVNQVLLNTTDACFFAGARSRGGCADTIVRVFALNL
jgi:hypothetical protein